MGANHGRQFHVNMFEEDIHMMEELVKLHPEKETGGNLFGLWNNDEEPVLHVVLGPAIGCTRTEVSFYQSIPYLERVGRLLTERFLLCHIGEWHSHHKLRLSEPSSGDSSTVIRNFPRGARGFILIIANILPSGVVELSPYLYRQGQTTYEKGLIRPLGSPCSPFRKIDVIKENIERDEDRSTTAHEHKRTSKSWGSEQLPGNESYENKAYAYMFEDDKQMIENKLLQFDGDEMEGELLGLWTSHGMPVLHLVQERNSKSGKEQQPFSSQTKPTNTLQTQGILAQDYTLGKYILSQREPEAPSYKDIHREYPNGGLLILVYKVTVENESVAAIHPYLFKKGSANFEPLEMYYLPGRNVFSQKMNDNIEKEEEEESGITGTEVDDLDARGSPNFQQHKYSRI